MGIPASQVLAADDQLDAPGQLLKPERALGPQLRTMLRKQRWHMAIYILGTLPFVRRHDKAAFGTYRTKDMVLAYYNALTAGDTDIDVAV